MENTLAILTPQSRRQHYLDGAAIRGYLHTPKKRSNGSRCTCRGRTAAPGNTFPLFKLRHAPRLRGCIATRSTRRVYKRAPHRPARIRCLFHPFTLPPPGTAPLPRARGGNSAADGPGYLRARRRAAEPRAPSSSRHWPALSRRPRAPLRCRSGGPLCPHPWRPGQTLISSLNRSWVGNPEGDRSWTLCCCLCFDQTSLLNWVQRQQLRRAGHCGRCYK